MSTAKRCKQPGCDAEGIIRINDGRLFEHATKAGNSPEAIALTEAHAELDELLASHLETRASPLTRQRRARPALLPRTYLDPGDRHARHTQHRR
jgi:hypothetical protein